MDRFDFIPDMDNEDQEKTNTLLHLISENTPVAFASTPNEYGYKSGRICVMSRYIDVPDCVTVSWCRAFAAEAEDLTGKPICHVETQKGDKRTVYIVPEDCLTIYDKELPVYRNKAGNIFRDTVAIIES